MISLIAGITFLGTCPEVLLLSGSFGDVRTDLLASSFAGRGATLGGGLGPRFSCSEGKGLRMEMGSFRLRRNGSG